MGRLRNLSASFKAAAFPTASNNSYSRATPESSDTLAGKPDGSAVVRETSATSLPQASASSPALHNPMVYTPPTIVNDEIEELKPVFSYLSSHANKLYQEGYFLKLDDLDTSGKPNPVRAWTECFAQLVGTILSFWDAEALDAAGNDGEVAPSFINLADASIKMIETLPTRNQEVQPLQNVLSVSTAGKNRYLLHFNSLHSLTQWTAGIRLAMFENASLHELYTGSLIAGKGRHLNSINQIMTKNRFRIEDWARVRFGAGTPWRRCWCVIEPPDEKEWQKSQKKLGKRSAYEKVTYPKGDIKFFDTKKTKKALPIATITDAYSAYAIYPQSKPLINESTLIKLEGRITIHSQPESKTEGFVFVMPEVHPAVSGFEMMLRWLMPVYDTFSLYGRPTRLVPDTLDPRSLMFAMPKERRYGYLDIIDVAALIHTEDSDQWTEREWRKKLKEGVARRMSMQTQGRSSNIERIRDNSPRQGMRFSDAASVHSTQSPHRRNESSDAIFELPKKTMTAPTQLAHNYHARSASGSIPASPKKMRESMTREYTPSRLSEEPSIPDHAQMPTMPHIRQPLKPRVNEAGYTESANSSDSDMQNRVYAEDVERDMIIQQKPVQPVVAPPEMQHQANEQPRRRPADRPELRREKSRMSDATLSQMNPRVLEELRREGSRSPTKENGATAQSAAALAWRGGADQTNRGVNDAPADPSSTLANPHRPAVVTNTSSTSIQGPTKRKPLLSAAVLQDSSRPPIDRNYSETSNYSMQNHDRDSSPDYASHASQDPPAEREKVRGGTRKVVGSPDNQVVAQKDNLHIDFGQTLRLTPDDSRPNSRPTTATGRRSPFDSLGRPDTASGRRSPFDSLGQPSPGRQSPFDAFGSSSPSRTPEKQSSTERLPHSRSQSYAWRPRVQAENTSPGGMSAEEFVQQRASMAMQPQGYVAHRTLSSGRIDQVKTDQKARPDSPTSPRKLQKRALSSRQSSRGSMDYSAHLSAREQEHVAKMTGGPLLSNVNQAGRTPDPSVGLIGAIEARDQEKQNIKKGLQGQMVQAAIDQRSREMRTSQSQQAPLHGGPYQYPRPQQLLYQNSYQNQLVPDRPMASDFPAHRMTPSHQAYWSNMQQPTQDHRQSMYVEQKPMYQRTESMQQAGYPAYPVQPRPQSTYSQYGGFYAPQPQGKQN
ncbi:hypothetical protein LTR51_000688 [Lithohypha guttulata]|nr:hypothetical protein LTR51_000688 [Lithohypha guttulata]